MSGRPNILLIVLDSVRARNTSVHDHRHDTTPFLDQFTADACTYERAVAPGMWSLPSHVSMFTGLSVPEHGIRDRSTALEPGHTIFEELYEHGYETGVFSDNPFLTALDVGLKQAFDRVEGSSTEHLFPDALNPHGYEGEPSRFALMALRSGYPLRSLANGAVSKLLWDHPKLIPERISRRTAAGSVPGRTYTDLFLNWHEERTAQGDTWAACINYMDAHHPYDPAPKFDEWGGAHVEDVKNGIQSMPASFYTGDNEWWECELLEYRYDGTIRAVDHELRRVITALGRRGDLSDTLVVVTGDHGEGLGDRSRVKSELRIAGHNVGVHEALLHVPLVVSYPDAVGTGGTRISDPVSLTGFPNVVRACLDGSDAPERAFVSEDPVVAVGDVGTSSDDEIRQLLDDDEYPGDARVVYEAMSDRGPGVRKYVTWGTDECVIRSIDAHTAYVVDDEARVAVDEAFDALSPAGVAHTADGVEATAKRRLEDLGYI